MKSCKPHEKTKNIKMLNLLVKNWKLRLWCSLFHFFHVIFEISNFNMWTEKHLAQASCTELTLLYTMRGFWLKSIIFKSCILWATYPPQIVYVAYKRPLLRSRCFWRLTLDLTLASFWKSKKVALKSLNIFAGELFMLLWLFQFVQFEKKFTRELVRYCKL